MPIKRPQLVNGEIYHVVIRAIEGLNLFRDNKDYYRFVHDLFEFNDEKPASSNYRKTETKIIINDININANVSRTVLDTLNNEAIGKRKLLVEIFAFCLMPNHIHLLLRQLKENGISDFMRKIGAGFVGYYNNRYQRKGHLFEGKYRVVHIEDNEQLKTAFVYVHANPVSLIVPGWKENGIQKDRLPEVIKFIEKYKWSSYSDYLGIKNFPSLTSRDFLTKVMGRKEGAREFVNGWLEFKSELTGFSKIGIE